MGSIISTIIMVSHVIIIAFSVFIHGTSALKWVKTTRAELPIGSAKVYPNTKTPHYFCRVNLKSGGMSYGQLTDSSPECVYPENDSKVGAEADCYLGQGVYSD